MAVTLTYAAGVPVVKVGRIAGQFAKPRSSPTERIGDLELDTFRGHMVNDEAFDAAARTPDPARLITAYHQAAATLNLLRAFTKGGFADLSHVHQWNQEFVASSAEGRRYERIAGEIDRALRFMAACGIELGAGRTGLHQTDFWTEPQTPCMLVTTKRRSPARTRSRATGWTPPGHMLWIGGADRASPTGAHVEFSFLSGVINPLAVKLDAPRRPSDEVLDPVWAAGPGAAAPAG